MWLYWHSNCSLVSSLLLRLGSLVVFISPFLLCLWIWHLIVLSSCRSIQVKFNHANICLCTHPCVGVLAWSVKSQLSHSEDICLRKTKNCNLFINNVPHACLWVWAFRRGEQVVLASKS
jgi:hypothetical protein